MRADLGLPAQLFRRLGIDYTDPFGGRFRVELIRVQGERGVL